MDTEKVVGRSPDLPRCTHGKLTKLRCWECDKLQKEADLIAQRLNAPDMRAGRDGKRVIVVQVQTDLDSERHRASKNVNVSALEYLYSRKVIAVHHFEAGNLFSRLSDQAGSGPRVNYDPDQSGGGRGDPFTLTRINAIEELNRVHNQLNDVDMAVVEWLCCQDMNLGDIRKKGAQVFPSKRPSPWAKDAVSATVRGALESLAEVTGHATKSGARTKGQ